MGLSIRAYAKQRGVSDAAVRKAIKTGRISLSADKTIDPARADTQWQQNTDVSQQRGTVQQVQPETRTRPVSSESMSSGGTTFTQARTVNEVVKAQTGKVRLAKMKGDLIDRSQAIAHVFKLARAERDAWLNWPSRVSATMASVLKVDAHVMHVAMESAVREHLQELGEFRMRVD